MNKPHQNLFKRPLLSSGKFAVSLLTMCLVAPAFAFEIDVGDPDTRLRWDNTIRYTVGKRLKGQDDMLVNSGFKGQASGNIDDGDRAFGKGALTVNRFDLLSEFDLVYQKQHGFRITGAAWKDYVYNNVRTSNQLLSNSNHSNNGSAPAFGLNAETEKYAKQGSEVLDAFVFTGFELGDSRVFLKGGKHTVYWGESLYNVSNSIAFSQSAVDLAKLLQSPGVEAKEAFLPRNQISAQWVVNNELTLSAQQFLDWDAFRFPNPGTYLSFNDVLGKGAEFYNFNGTLIARGADIKGKKSGDFGLAARYSPEWLGGAMGLYLRRYTNMVPTVALQPGKSFIAANLANALGINPTQYAAGAYDTALTNAGRAAFTSTNQFSGAPNGLGNFYQVYGDKVQMIGFSLAKNIEGLSVGFEFNHRTNEALTSFPTFVMNANNYAAFQSLFGKQIDGYAKSITDTDKLIARGTTQHMLINVLGMLPNSGLWDTGSWGAELNWARLVKVTKNEKLYKGQDWYQGIDKPTKDSFGINLSVTPGWFGIFPSADLYLPISYARGISGNSPTSGTINKDNGSFSLGARLEYQTQHIFELRYVSYFGAVSYQDIDGNGVAGMSVVPNGATAPLRDRRQLLFNYRTSF